MSLPEKEALLDLHLRAQAVVDGEPHVYADLGRQFHQDILSGCRNNALIEVTAALAKRVNPFRRFQVLAPDRIRTNQADHERIVRAIMDGDTERAGAALREHTSNQGDVLVRFIALHKVSYSDVASHYSKSGAIGAGRQGGDQ
jgi:DNA-binding GntR family transcriptional regulator